MSQPSGAPLAKASDAPHSVPQAWKHNQSFEDALQVLSKKTLNKTSKQIESFITDCLHDDNTIFPFSPDPLPQQQALVTPLHKWHGNFLPSSFAVHTLEQILPTQPHTGFTLVVVPTQNAQKLGVVKSFMEKVKVELKTRRHIGPQYSATAPDFKLVTCNAESEVGEQPYSHHSGMMGASNRVKNAHQKIWKQYQDYRQHPKSSSMFDNVTKIKFVSFENHIDLHGRDGDPFDHAAIIIYDDSTKQSICDIGSGVRVSSYHLRFAQACHYEQTELRTEDETKGLLTVGKAIALLSRGSMSSDDWHLQVCQKSRYDIIREDLWTLWLKSPDILL